jgi:hypothetical protein
MELRDLRYSSPSPRNCTSAGQRSAFTSRSLQ